MGSSKSLAMSWNCRSVHYHSDSAIWFENWYLKDPVSFHCALLKGQLTFVPCWGNVVHSCLIMYTVQFMLQFWFNNYMVGAQCFPISLAAEYSSSGFRHHCVTPINSRGDSHTSDCCQAVFPLSSLFFFFLLSLFQLICHMWRKSLLVGCCKMT